MKMYKEILDVKIKLSEGAKMPVFSTEGAAGADLHALTVEYKQERNGPIYEYDTGVAMEIPPGHVGLIFPRSSLTTKTTLILGNSTGVIDSDYRGTIKFQFRNINNFITTKYEVGDKIGQIIIMPIPAISFTQVDKLSDTNRGESGFGSTGA